MGLAWHGMGLSWSYGTDMGLAQGDMGLRNWHGAKWMVWG